MRNALLLSLLSFFALLLQSVLLRSFAPTAVMPDIVLLVVVFIALRHPHVLGLVLAFGLGLLVDLAEGVFLGPHGAGYVLAFGVVRIVSKGMYAERAGAVVALTFIASSVKALMIVFMLSMYTSASLSLGLILRDVAWGSIITAIIAPLGVALCARVLDARGGRRRRQKTSYTWAAETS